MRAATLFCLQLLSYLALITNVWALMILFSFPTKNMRSPLLVPSSWRDLRSANSTETPLTSFGLIPEVSCSLEEGEEEFWLRFKWICGSILKYRKASIKNWFFQHLYLYCVFIPLRLTLISTQLIKEEGGRLVAISKECCLTLWQVDCLRVRGSQHSTSTGICMYNNVKRKPGMPRNSHWCSLI